MYYSIKVKTSAIFLPAAYAYQKKSSMNLSCKTSLAAVHSLHFLLGNAHHNMLIVVPASVPFLLNRYIFCIKCCRWLEDNQAALVGQQNLIQEDRQYMWTATAMSSDFFPNFSLTLTAIRLFNYSISTTAK